VHWGAFFVFLFFMGEGSERKKAEVFEFAGAKVTLRQRADGYLIAAWREDGRVRKSSRADTEETRVWARRKARELGAASGKQWVSPAAGERMAWLERIAGGGADAVARLLGDVEEALKMLEGRGSLREAARCFLVHEPVTARDARLAEAVERFLKFYAAHHPRMTVNGPRSELGHLAKESPGLRLLDVTPEMLGRHTRRGEAAVRTVRNRISYWVLFFNWCAENGLWPEGKKSPALKVKKPRKLVKAPVVFWPEEGRMLVAAVLAGCPQHLGYAVLAGWLGLRPSECVRMDWGDVDFAQGLVHVRAEVARKVGRERWVPMTAEVARILQECKESRRKASGRKERICRLRAQVDVSRVARDAGLAWSIDVLRHSRITYRLQETRDIGMVAEESGNSPSEIRASYKRPIPPEMWRKWEAVLVTVEARDWVDPNTKNG
jgi:integrase